MANYETRCPHCGSTLNVSSEWEGMELACPLCSKNFTLPRNVETGNNDAPLLLTPKAPQQVVPQQVIPRQVIPQQYRGYQQPQMPPPGYQQQYQGAPQMPPAPPRKAPAFLTSYKFYSIIIAVLLLIGGIFIINAVQDDGGAPDGASIAADKKRHDETVKKLEERYITSMITKSKEVKTYQEAFAILDQLVKDFPSSSARSKIDERLQALEKENATIIFESNNNNKRTYMIFKYSYDLEEKFKNIKAGFYNMREINVKRRELSRSHTLAFIGRSVFL